MSERDYSRLREYLRPISASAGPLGAVHNAIADTLLDLMDASDALAKQIAAIERAATCGTGLNEPLSISPAQAGMGEVSAESEWPRYYRPAHTKTFHLGHTLVKWNGRDDKPLMCCHPSEPDKPWYSAGLADTFAAWIREGKWIEVPSDDAEARIAAARGEKPQTVVEWAESIGVPFPADTDSHGCPVPPRSAPDDQPPFHVGQVVECVDAGVGNGVENGERYTVEAIRKAANPKVAWLVDVGNGGPVFAHRFRPIPATVEQGPTPGPCVVCGYEAWQKLVESGGHLCRVCDLAGRARDAETMEREHRATIADLRQQLSAATAANVERDGLTFAQLRAANTRRLPLFKNRKGEPAHSEPDGSDWLLSAWSNAVCGELGEAANLIKKIERGDMTLGEARADLGKELADVQTYLDILAFRSGVNLGEATAEKFNEVSERVGCDVRLPILAAMRAAEGKG